MGYTLGMSHTEGYMTETSSDPNRRSVFTIENISDVFKTMNTSVKNPTGVKNRKGSGVGRATIHIIGGYNPRAPKTEKGYKRLNNGTVKSTSK